MKVEGRIVPKRLFASKPWSKKSSCQEVLNLKAFWQAKTYRAEASLAHSRLGDVSFFVEKLFKAGFVLL